MKSLIVLSLFIYTLSSSACDCIDANYREADITKAIKNFINVRLDVEEDEIIQIEIKQRENFATFYQRVMLKILKFRLGSTDPEYQCEKACAEGVNEKLETEVNFIKDETRCLIKLRVKMTSDLENLDEFKAKVKQKESIICE